MPRHPYHDVAITAAFNTEQARSLAGHTPETIQLQAVLGVIERAGVARGDVDGIVSQYAPSLSYLLGLGPAWTSRTMLGISGLMDAANAIAAGVCETVVVVGGSAGRESASRDAADWTRPSNEFVVAQGMFTAAHYALLARRHMHVYGTTPEQLATVAATIRTNGHVNPDAVYYGRGPFRAADVLASPMVADPLHLLDCAMTAEGACALLVTTASRAESHGTEAVYLLGAGSDTLGPAYEVAPTLELSASAGDDFPNGLIGRRAARNAFRMAGLERSDVDVFELYDAFSFEVLRQFEAFEYCEPGEGGPFVLDGNIDHDGACPTTTDGGLLSFSHCVTGQTHQRIARGVHQLQNGCATRQVPGAEVALCSNSGAGSLSCSVVLLGKERP